MSDYPTLPPRPGAPQPAGGPANSAGDPFAADSSIPNENPIPAAPPTRTAQRDLSSPPPVFIGGGDGSHGNNGGGSHGGETPAGAGNPDKKPRNKKMIIGGGIGGIVVLGVGAVLLTNGILSPSGTHAYDILPADDAMVYAEVNLDPTAEQKTAWMKLSQKFELGDQTIRESTSSQLGDFADVDPWLGDRVAVAAYKDLDGDGADDMFLAYQIKDADAAEAFSKSYEQPYLIVDDYFVVSEGVDGKGALDALTDKDGDTLADNEDFKDDLDFVGKDNVFHAWVDIANAQSLQDEILAGTNGVVPGVAAPSAEETPVVTGRLVMSAELKSDGVEARVTGRSLTADGKSAADYADLKMVGDEFKDLPAGMAALSIGGLDESLKQLWTDEEFAEMAAQAEAAGEQLGLNLPDDFTKIVGEVTSVSADFQEGSTEADVFSNMKGADAEVLTNLLTQTGLTEGGPSIKVEESPTGASIILGNPSETKIADTPEILDTLIDLDKAGAAFYIDLDGATRMIGMAFGGEAPEDAEELGDLGVTVSNDGDDATVNLKWIVK